MTYKIQSYKSVDNNYIYIQATNIYDKVGPTISPTIKLPTTLFLTFLKDNTNHTASPQNVIEALASRTGTTWDAMQMLISTEIMLELNDSQSVDPNKISANTIKKAPITTSSAKNSPVDWPLPEYTSPFTPIRNPFQGGYDKGWRLGYATIQAPLTHYSYDRVTYVSEVGNLREADSIKTTQGKSVESYTLQYVASGPYEIEKYVQEVLEQISINPFVCVEGGPFGGRYEMGELPAKELAIRSYTISTLPQSPNQILVQIDCDPYVWNWWSPQTEKNEEGFQRELLDDAICYPLYKLWCKDVSRSKYKGGPLNGKFKLSFPSKESLINAENVLNYSKNEDSEKYTVETLKAFYEGNYKRIKSDLVKEVSSGDKRYFIVKAQTPEMFSQLTGFELIDGQWVSRKNGFFIGLMEWSAVNYKTANLYGERLPNSSVIQLDNSPAVSLKRRQADKSLITDVPNSYPTLNEGIEEYLNTLYATDPNKVEKIALDMKLLATEPFHRFAVVIELVDPPVVYQSISSPNPSLPTVYSALKENLLAGQPPVHTVNKPQTVDNFLFDLSRVQSELQDPHNPDLRSLLRSADTVLDVKPGESNIIIEQITGGRQHTLTALSTDATPLPLHQYMGSMGSIISVSGKAQGMEAIQLLQSVKHEFDSRALNKTSGQFNMKPDNNNFNPLGDQFLLVENEIFNLLGVDFVMPVDLNFDTIDSLPGMYNFTMKFIEYSPKLRSGEKVKYLSTFNQANKNSLKYFNEVGDEFIHPIRLKALDYFSLQGALRNETAYPDMFLPTQDKVNDWINSCKRIALSRTDTSIQLSSEDKKIERHISNFIDNPLYRFNRANMSKWKEFISDGVYVDPDFYYYYSANDSFNNLVDNVATDILGERNGLSGTAASAKVSMRLHDTEYDIISVDTPEHLSAASDTATTALESRKDNTYYAGTNQKADALLEQEESVRKERVQIGSSLGWWLSGSEGIEANGVKIIPIDNKVFTEPGAILPFDSIAEKDKAKNGVQEEDIDITRVPDGYKDFFRVDWRTAQVRKYADQGRANPSTDQFDKATHYHESRFMLWDVPHLNWFRFVGASDEILMFEPTGIGIITPFDRAPYPSVEEWSNALRKNVMVLNSKDKISKVFTAPFLPRVAYTNAAFEARANQDNKQLYTFDDTGSILEKAIKNRRVFDSLGYNYRVDPHMLRAYFISRSGFGTVKSIDSGINGGWGEIDFAKLGIEADKPEQALQIFASEYSKNLKKYKYPTLALIATDLYLTSKDKSVPERFMDELQALSNSSPIDLKLGINSLLKQLGPKSQVYDFYYASWLECNRVFGPYVNPRLTAADVFFTATNPMIVLDIGRNGDGRTLMTDYSPTGNSTLVWAARNDLKQNAYNSLQDRQIQDISVEQQVLLNNKQQVALSPTSEDAVWGMLYDMRAYSPHGRLLGSYPSYCVLFINEGFYWQGGREKLWDQYYTRTNLTSIEVFKTRHSPASVATVTLSNVFHQLTQYTAQEAMLHNMALSNRSKLFNKLTADLPGTIAQGFSEYVLKDVSKEMKDAWQKNFLNFFVMSAGARLHIRMGYGSNIAKLPVVFNGTIVEAPVGKDIISLVAVGDGSELEKNSVNKLQKTQQGWFYRDGGSLFGAGKSPANIITESLINVETIWPKLTGGRFFRDFSHGIAHFGDVFYDGLVHSPAEVMINIYDSSPTSFEQGVASWRNIFDANALWTWDSNSKSNWFSVSVSEPSPWKVIKTCTNACMDFVCSAEPIMTQSTVFFGKFWWPFNFAWKESILMFDYDPAKRNETVVQANARVADQLELKEKNTFFNRVSEFVKFIDDNISDQLPQFFGIKVAQVISKGLDSALKNQSSGSEQALNFSSVIGGLFTGFAGLASIPILNSYIDFNKTATQASRTSEIDLMKDVDFITAHMNWKPFSQFHIVSSELNLLDNQLEANSNFVFTDAIGQHTYNGVLSSDSIERTSTWCVDDDIQASDRETALVDTGLYVTGFQAGLAPRFFKGIAGLALGWLPGYNEFVKGVPPTPGVENSVVNALVNSVKEMYQGWMTITGTASIKPQDMLSFSDRRSGLSGPLGVKEVIHRFDSQVGFITIISPDCISFPQTNIQGSRILNAVQGNVLAQTAAIWGMKNVAVSAKWASKRLFDKSKTGELFDIIQTQVLKDYFTNKPPISEDLVKQHYQAMSAEIGSVVKSIEPADLNKEDAKIVIDMYKRYGFKVNSIEEILDVPLEDFKKFNSLLESKEIEELLSSLNKISNNLSDGLQNRINSINVLDTIFRQSNVDDLLKLQKAFNAHITYMSHFKEGVIEDLKRTGTFNIFNTGEELDQTIERLVQTEWSKFLNKHKDLIDVADIKIISSEDALKALFEKFPDLVGNSNELTDLLTKRATLSKKDVRLLQKVLDLNLIQTYEPTLMDESWWEAFKRANPYFDLGSLNQNESMGNGARNLLNRSKTVEEIATDHSAPGKLKVSWDKAKELIKLAKDKDFDGIKDSLKIADNALEEMRLAKIVEKVGKASKATITTIRVAKYGGPQILVSLAADVIWTAIGGSIIDGINNHLKSRQCVKIFPLSSRGIPYTAGIKGHQGAVVGDDPGWLDRQIGKWVGGKPIPGEVSSDAFMWTSLIAGLLGIETPNYYASPTDEEYLRSLNR